MDSNSNPITNANPGMPAIPSSPAPEPVVPTPSDAMPTIPTPVDNTVPPEPATSSVPTFNPAAQAAPATPTVSSTPTSFGMNSSYDTGYNAGMASTNGSNGGFDPSSVSSFFTPETPSFSNGGIIAATEPIIEPDPIPEPDPEEVELNSPFQAAAPVPGSIGSAVSVPKEAPAPASEETPAPAPEPAVENTDVNPMDISNPAVSSEPIVNPNNPFLAQSAAAEVNPISAEAPVATEAPAMAVAPDTFATPDMQAVPAPEIPQFDPNSPLPMPGDVMGDPMQNGAQNAMMNPIQDPNMPTDGMPFAFDSANNQMNPFAEAAALNADPNAAINGGPVKAKDNKKLIIIGAAAAAVLLIVVLLVVMMGGGNKSTTADNGGGATPAPTPTPTPTPSNLSNGTTICKRNLTEDEYTKYEGYTSGSIEATINYRNNLVSSMSIAETVNFEDETTRKAGLRAMKNEYSEAMTRYSIDEDSAMLTEYDKTASTIIGTRKIESLAGVDSGIIKLFGIVSTDGEYIAEDTIGSYEEKGYTCTDSNSTSGDEEDDDESIPDTNDEEPEEVDEDLNDLYYDEEES